MKMKLYLIGNLAPVSPFIQLTFPIEKYTPEPRKERHSHAFIINELFNIDPKRHPTVLAFTSEDKALKVLGTSAQILYTLEVENLNIASYECGILVHSVRSIAQKAILISAKIQDTVYQINLDLSKYKLISTHDFIKAYNKQYKSEWFSNPWSKMKQLIAGPNLTMSDIYEHAFRNPYSRTANILRSMQVPQSLLTNEVEVINPSRNEPGGC
ncbi:hypothetical protein [Legionella clemsonensis]|uniref:Uncharacterized protein n=1 Tax=Legionella clemsonensis TaxID=1867846 RepID=A0A222P0M5_9GAMM|nr:hypothetical protein [Legionella clemsonensis]ASQ45345.1 hypothetical protein clem_03935 [Legionella clemsonensis]